MATCSGCGVEDYNGLGLANLIEVGMSADMFLGVPFNIASYALLTLMMAQITNMVPGDFIWTGGDCHIYANHLEQTDEMLSREPLPLPTVQLHGTNKEIDDFEWASIELVNYKSHPRISAPMAK